MALEAVKESEAEAKPKAEKQTNCLACNKLIKKLKRYYRDGKFYCSKRCWRTFINKSKPQGDGLASNSQSHKAEEKK
ncbi:MAG: hypothetical protein Q8N80_04775 [Candidatus Omnitrophota bacterium]|nr:hypothetical protein [Candidatus Omnitrophota bacterium]